MAVRYTAPKIVVATAKAGKVALPRHNGSVNAWIAPPRKTAPLDNFLACAQAFAKFAMGNITWTTRTNSFL